MTVRQLRVSLGLTIAILALSWPLSSIIDVRDGAAPSGVRLELSAAYIAMSPVSRTLDMLSLFSNPQSIWFFGVIAVAMVIWILMRPGASRRSRRVRILRALGGLLAATATVEGAAALAPRPMARLIVDDPEIVVVDFHSHTRASHDAYQRLTAERNREWHASGGFDIAYITDHVKWGGAESARANNPVRAGDGTSLLTAVEGHYHKVSTVMLALVAADTSVLNGWGELQPGTPSTGRPPVTIAAIPGNLDSVEAAVRDTLPRFSGIELVDAAPRGLGQLDTDEARIREIASKYGLVMVAASNNHGWGRTVAAWNLLRIPGWRSLSPDSVGRLIESRFEERATDDVVIIQRRRARTHGAGALLTLPVATYQLVRSLTPMERLAWVAWIWGLAIALNLLFPGRRAWWSPLH